MNIYRVLVKLSEGLESAKVRYRIHCMRVFGKPNYKKKSKLHYKYYMSKTQECCKSFGSCDKFLWLNGYQAHINLPNCIKCKCYEKEI